jgi:hypothetical protein
MRICDPITITDTGSLSQLSASNVPETDESEYAAGTSYTAGDRVMVTDPGVHKIYEALRSTTGEYPPDNTNGSDPAWLEVGPTNRWAMFNRVVGQATQAAETYSESTYAVSTLSAAAAGIAVEIAPQQAVNYLAAFGIRGNHADVIVHDGGGNQLYAERKQLNAEISEAGWWWYFFEPFVQVRDAISFPNLPTISNGTIRLAIQKNQQDANAECGVLVLGVAKTLGVSVYGTRVGIIDFSRKERDAFGNFTITERGFAKEMTAEVKVDFGLLSSVQQRLSEVRAKPVVYEASDNVAATLIYGFFRDFEILISTPTVVDATIEIEGLV